MSESLKDQLLALGLTPRQKSQKSDRTDRVQKNTTKNKLTSDEISLDQAFRIREQEERRAKSRAQAEKRERERRQRQINQEIRSLVKAHALRDESADCKRNFLYKGRIRSVLATRQQIEAINAGELGVVYLRGSYHLLPADQVKAVEKIAPEHVPDLLGQGDQDDQDHPVPDDLIW